MKDRVKEFLDTAEGRKPKEPLDIFVERLMADFAKAEVLRELRNVQEMLSRKNVIQTDTEIERRIIQLGGYKNKD